MATVIKPLRAPADHQAASEAIARDTETNVEVVQEIYEQELAALASDARITTYLDVLAGKRTKDLLSRGRQEE